MPYSTRRDVESRLQITSKDFGQATDYGYNYENMIVEAIADADAQIDEYCQVPEGFFNPSGIEIENEYHDGIETGHHSLFTSTSFFGFRQVPILRLAHTPVLSITKLEENTSGSTWTTRTEGRDSDYLVMGDGIRFLRNIPDYEYKNIRVTYKAGYAQTPRNVNTASKWLAAKIIKNTVDSATTATESMGGFSSVKAATLNDDLFTPDIQRLLKNYRRKVPVKMQW